MVQLSFLLLLLLSCVGMTAARVCYPATTTSTPYDIIEEATVETRRGCEVLCTANTTCAGISFKDAGYTSSCILLSVRIANEICMAPTEIFLKQETGCPDRTDVTAEYVGNDPCIDETVPTAFRGIGTKPICNLDQNDIMVIRAITADGRRITLDNEKWNYLEKYDNAGDGMWAFRYADVSIPIVTAMCVRAGSQKCPCTPILNIPTVEGVVGYPAQPDVLNPCQAWTWLYWDVTKRPADGIGYFSREETQNIHVTCKAGLWILWRPATYNNWAVTSLSCYPI